MRSSSAGKETAGSGCAKVVHKMMKASRQEAQCAIERYAHKKHSPEAQASASFDALSEIRTQAALARGAQASACFDAAYEIR